MTSAEDTAAAVGVVVSAAAGEIENGLNGWDAAAELLGAAFPDAVIQSVSAAGQAYGIVSGCGRRQAFIDLARFAEEEGAFTDDPEAWNRAASVLRIIAFNGEGKETVWSVWLALRVALLHMALAHGCSVVEAAYIVSEAVDASLRS